jgi:hypothetical protein
VQVACNPGAASGTDNAKVTITTAAQTSASGTATLATMSANFSGGSVTVPAVIPATNVTCTNCLSATGNIAPTTVSPAGSYTVGSQLPFVSVGAGNFVVTHPGGPTSPALKTYTDSGAQSISPGTYYGGLCIGVPRFGTNSTCSSAHCLAANAYTPIAYSPAQTGTIGAGGNNLTITAGGGTPIRIGDYIQIAANGPGTFLEKMKVTGGSGTSWIVDRGQLGTAQTAHTTAAAITYITGSPDVTMGDGTYIMAGGGFFVCGAAKLTGYHVLVVNTSDRDPGTGTVPAGGDLDQIQFDTNGYITMGPPDSGPYQGLSIFQPVTEEMSPFSAVTYAAPGEALAAAITDLTGTSITVNNPGISDGELIEIGNEVMRVTSGGGTTSLTVDRGDTLYPGSDTSATHASGSVIKRVAGSKCDGRSSALTDILFSSIGPVGSTDGLNGLTGSIYAPHPYALFADAVSGNADISVMSGCLFINGGDATFSFQPRLRFGSGSVTFLGEWG